MFLPKEKHAVSVRSLTKGSGLAAVVVLTSACVFAPPPPAGAYYDRNDCCYAYYEYPSFGYTVYSSDFGDRHERGERHEEGERHRGDGGREGMEYGHKNDRR